MQHHLTFGVAVCWIFAMAQPLVAQAPECAGSATADISIGVSQFHCQGGTCWAYGRVAIPGQPGWTTYDRSGHPRGAFAFSVEPILWRIDPVGPAAGLLEEGDILVAVEGWAVTSDRASEVLHAMLPGRDVRLTVRRGDRLHDVRVVPDWTCDPVLVTAGHERRPTRTHAAAPDRGADGRTILNVAPGARLVLGTLGVGLQCSPRCAFVRYSGSAEAIAEFRDYPTIISLEPGGAADRAGLAPGDVLTHIDGLDLRTVDGGRRFGTLQAGEAIEVRFRRGNRPERTTLTVDLGGGR